MKKGIAILTVFTAVMWFFAHTQDRQVKIRQETNAECSSGMNSVYHMNRLIKNDSAFEAGMEGLAATFDDSRVALVTVSSWKAPTPD